jgi:hypothetical protein
MIALNVQDFIIQVKQNLVAWGDTDGQCTDVPSWISTAKRHYNALVKHVAVQVYAALSWHIHGSDRLTCSGEALPDR